MRNEFTTFEEVLKALREPMPPEIEQLQPEWWVAFRKRLNEML
ncbi:MAG: hypothetical protein NT129_00760 [Candidatus Aenigmarchaeota archaeon]|nr:hypothetical protein [Candidatus Aenigmarchaeota archaeon]